MFVATDRASPDAPVTRRLTRPFTLNNGDMTEFFYSVEFTASAMGNALLARLPKNAGVSFELED